MKVFHLRRVALPVGTTGPWERRFLTHLNFNKAQHGFRDFVDIEERNPILPDLQDLA